MILSLEKERSADATVSGIDFICQPVVSQPRE